MQEKEKKIFSFIERRKSFKHALNGIKIIFQTQPNFWIHIIITIAVVFWGLYFQITQFEWVAIVLSVGMVLTAEAFNTAIEFDMDLTSPNYHPYAKYTKDCAAAATLISSIIVVIVGLIIFIPKILIFFN